MLELFWTSPDSIVLLITTHHELDEYPATGIEQRWQKQIYIR